MDRLHGRAVRDAGGICEAASRYLGGHGRFRLAEVSPVWSRTGRELFYQGMPDARVTVTGYTVAGDSFAPARPRVWNETRVDGFDLMPDGKRVVVIPAADQKETTHAMFR